MAAPLINCQSITKSFGLVPVFKDLEFALYDRDRVGIIGPNGAGKSTLLKILAEQDTADNGIISAKRGLKAGYVAQSDEFQEGQTIRDVLTNALSKVHRASDLGRIETMIGRAKFPDPDAFATKLSGGWKKRLAICVELIKEPELLLLDEPTNHLDLEGIDWLEDVLDNAPFAFAVISHDRYLLESSCTTIVEINRIYPGGNFIVKGGYGEYMRRKAEFLEGHASQMASMANKLRRETEWLNRGAQARSTKQQARIKSAGTLKNELESANQRSKRQAVEFEFSASQRKTKKLVEAKDISKSFGDRTLFHDLSFLLGPQMRLGLVGPNGSGKSTLIKLLQKLIPADQGTVDHADNLRIVYYDQHRETLPEGRSLRRALAEDSDTVQVQGRSIHVSSYAKSFGFRVEQLDTPVGKLSGGERARLLLARMLQRPADLLILDEPTNDLDIDTLEVLEESLLSFPGAVILVTHDRYLMDRVSTGILGLDGYGDHGFLADYAQYVIYQRSRESSRNVSTPSQSKLPIETTYTNPAPKRPTTKKLSYLEQREWDSMESEILRAETTLSLAQEKTHDPSIASSSVKLQDACKAVELAQSNVDRLYARWAELEAKLKD
jgi:ABC transport system ATP-binding/permease protein